MYYKNYMINYSVLDKNITIAKMSENIPQDASGEWILSHTIDFIDVPRYQFDDCRNYLASNGLFLGVFPPNLIEKEIIDYHEFQKQAFEDVSKAFENDCKHIWSEEKFARLNDGRTKLNDMIELLTYINESRVEKYGLEPIDIDKEYGKYLKKYWGEEYGNE